MRGTITGNLSFEVSVSGVCANKRLKGRPSVGLNWHRIRCLPFDLPRPSYSFTAMSTLLDEADTSASSGWKSYLPASWTKSGPIVPVLRFSGTIGVVTPLRPGLSLTALASTIEKAFTMRGAKAVAIQINSPGGSAVQSMLIYRRLRALAEIGRAHV